LPYSRPTINEITDRIKGDIESSLALSSPILKKSVLWVFAKVFAGAVHLLFGFLDWVSRQVFPDTAEAEYLERWAQIWGISRKPSTFAEFDILATGTDGAVLPSGALLQSVSETEYSTQESVIITSGEALVHVVCQTSGSTGNQEPGQLLSLVSPVAGIDSSASVQNSGVVLGVDEELDQDLRQRVLDRIQNPPQGGAKSDYIAWAKEVAGVTRVWVYPTWMGPGTVGVVFALDNSEPIIPDSAKVSEVQTYIEERAPVGAQVTVFAPALRTIDFMISVTPDTPAVRAAVTAELRNYLFREGYPANILYLSQIREAVSNAPGERDSNVSVPSGNVILDDNEIAVLGSITWL
jgi:uncharacterized phage protein gp47/JayE